MFSHASVQPQVLAAVSQITSIINGLRTLSSSTRSSGHPRQDRTKSIFDQNSGTSTESTNISSLPTNLIQECGLNHLENDVTLEELCRILPNSAKQRNLRTHWIQSYASANTFFENKTGFSEHWHERDLVAATAWQLFQSQSVQSLISSRLSSCLHLQRRGFKSERSKVSHGLGNEKKESFMEDLRKSVYSRLFPDPKPKQETSSFHKMMGEHNHNPEMQEKMRIAFAEGYQASNRSETKETKSSFLSRTVRFVVGLISLWIIFQVLQVFYAAGGGGVRGLGVLGREQFEINPEEISVTFDDVKGVDEAKQELKDVVEFLKDPEKFTSLGAKLPKGVLLVGPPGIGKTLLARAVAGEAGVPFFHASGSEFDEIFVGTGARKVRHLFGAAKLRAPCVIFIDEIDSVGAKRTSSQIHPYANQTINQLLSEMDGFTQNEGVIVLGATNKRDNLDQALLRPGRFDVEVRVFPPDLKGRTEILEYYLSKVKTYTDIDIPKIARGTTGFTGADLENMVNQAALKAAIDGASLVNANHMDFARDKILMGPAKKTKITDEDTNWNTAFHEAGHTLVAYYSKDAVPLHKVTIIPRGMSLGHTSFIEDKEVFNKTKAQLLAEMDVAMGGRAAEELIYGMDKVTSGASNDFKQATSIATAMVKKLGMSEKVGPRVFSNSSEVDSGLSMLKLNEISPAVQEVLDSEINRLLVESYERAKHILKTHASEHKALAQALMKYETLDKDEIKAIIEGKFANKL